MQACPQCSLSLLVDGVGCMACNQAQLARGAIAVYFPTLDRLTLFECLADAVRTKRILARDHGLDADVYRD